MENFITHSCRRTGEHKIQKIPAGESILSYNVDLDLLMSDQYCTFCSQFKYRDDLNLTQMIFGDDFSRILYEDEYFVIVPALGQIVEGYLLIISKDHFNSLAELPGDMHERLINLKNKVSKVLSSQYSIPIFFEHGSFSATELGGGCINHAHLHAVPVDIGIEYTGLTELDPMSVEGIRYLWENRIVGPYIYFETIKHDAFYVNLRTKLPCQYIRRVIATKTGYQQNWDWRQYIGSEKIKNTILKLKDKF